MRNIFYYNTMIGELGIEENGLAITKVFLVDKDIEKGPSEKNETELLKEAIKQLNEYFDGKRKEFNLPLAPKGTEFQKKVWNTLKEIPFGETRSYGEIAKLIGNEKASRAVGMANNKNPIMIIIPCHRVIGANGKLVGYAGGIDIKEKLLNLEKN
ncbi:methylated-DNA--[protein]-cysteine S-methyltransferase [Clostridium saccharobutylicum]|uniref:Methylated-DNA--protein-cysteine methyltransferase n=1 Tax=Clostridium saccharobutylicum DSM 13864 TaxID=1345695 RepID=U5MLV1_CLOSA|nr:methylated-DNA--[protein]-cysteine S-methyltransferase [Clostridium saccharobutylicum]AGX41570.1 methylated-DNA--protein-cysteine methyltransferase Ogt [Clostridium saccharobutylicum DSM 13864]AQR88850.1 methylated-DNA--protein-cysteine methyltransferase, constitutive [Clostridium saccharobutylicum]AQR98749.1 methylated-DNA--protein-cysteine methyltransferase, constitutive [Clostridium saccharobutylicum]AQS08471.1 methylated-DNA--protein-cysteine methyltransferase, constitutive [Clostridium 